MNRIAPVLAFLIFQGTAHAWYTYNRTITIGLATTSNQSNFPVLIQLDSSNVGTTFKTAVNGGHIQNTITQSGGVAVTAPADILFIAAARTVAWEVEQYDPVNGILKVWVNVPVVYSGSNAAVVVFYGDATVTTQQNTGTVGPANVWDSNYKGVWHLTDGTTLTAVDSTVNANNGTLVNTPTATTGKVDGAGNFVRASNQYVNLGTGSSLAINGAITAEAWRLVPTHSLNGNGRIVSNLINSSGWKGYDMYFNSGQAIWQLGDGSGINASLGSTPCAENVICHNTFTFDGAITAKSYTNGALNPGGTSTSFTGLTSLAGGTVYMSQWPAGGANSWNGWIDELRISNSVRSADWIATEYANTNAPLTFNSTGSEITPAPPDPRVTPRHRIIQ